VMKQFSDDYDKKPRLKALYGQYRKD
jgi:hypothetical protein